MKTNEEQEQARQYPPGTLGFDWTAAALSAWLVGGLYLDGWAHHHGKVDQVFFTPWHAVLYTGGLAMVVFLVFTQFRNMSQGHSWRTALPRGYLLSLVGAGLFLLGGALDFVWHTVFGVEVDLETLLSPTHLFLATSAMFVISGPLRAAWIGLAPGEARGWKLLGPMVISATLVLSVLTFFTQFAHPISQPILQTAAANDQVVNQAGISDIYVMNEDGTGQKRLTASPDQFARYADWSPDGREVVFTRGDVQPAGSTESALYLMNADGSGLRQLTDLPGQEIMPAWSPDGARIAFVSLVGPMQAIEVINLDGGSPRQLTGPSGDLFGPAWSPDGTRIAYTSNASGSDQIYSLNAEGGSPTQLTSKGSHNWGAAWSPDGSQIVFASSRDSSLDIYRISPDGSNERRLTDTPNDDYAPAWSPDGRQIVFVTWHDGTADLYGMNADGGGVHNLTQSHALELNFPKWSPDGKTILYSANGHTQPSNLFNTQSLAIAGILLQTALLMGIVLWVVRRWALPVGALTLMFTLNGLLMSVFNDQTLLALPMLGAGLFADAWLWRLGPSTGQRRRFLLFAFLVPVGLNGLHFLVLDLTTGIGWSIHLWLGSIFMAGILGLLLGILAAPTEISARHIGSPPG